TVYKGDSAKLLENRLSLIRDYLLPGQPSAAELVKIPGKRFLYFEYWSKEPDEEMLRRLNQRQQQKDTLHYPNRTGLRKRKLLSDVLPQSFGGVDEIFEVTIRRS